jgi:uncharacterized protein (TIGR02996 family)
VTTGERLLRAILRDPADDAARLVYADWLEENGDGERAEFVRVQLDLAGEGFRRCPPHAHWTGCADVARHELLRARESELLEANARRWSGSLPRLLGGGAVAEAHYSTTFYLASAGSSPVSWWRWTRGLVSELYLPLALFTAPGNAAVLFAAHPLGRVILTDRKPDPDQHFGENPDADEYAGITAAAYTWWGDLPGTAPTPASLPLFLWNELDAALDNDLDTTTIEGAMEWLSRACVRWGRRQAESTQGDKQ